MKKITITEGGKTCELIIFEKYEHTYPKNEFFIYDGQVYYNNNPKFSRINVNGTDDILNHIPYGYVSLYELNVDRPSDQLIYPLPSLPPLYRTLEDSLLTLYIYHHPYKVNNI